MFRKSYGEVFAGDERWNGLTVPTGERFAWDAGLHLRAPAALLPGHARRAARGGGRRGARVLALLGDSVTTDHISPAGLDQARRARGALPAGAGRGAARLQLLRLATGQPRGDDARDLRQHPPAATCWRWRRGSGPLPEGGFTLHLPDGEQLSIYDAAMRYEQEGVPLVVLAGKEYGSGSSRDWAAKGTRLLGVRAVIAQSFERIHRSNLVGMGVLPLQFPEGESAHSLGLDGQEVFSIAGIAAAMRDGGAPPREVTGARRARGGRAGRVCGARAHRHAARGRVLPPRRHPAVRAARDAGLMSKAGGGRRRRGLPPGLLRDLLNARGPSGYETAPAAVWRKAAEKFAAVSTDTWARPRRAWPRATASSPRRGG